MAIDKREHLISILKDFDTALLFTRTSSGQMRGRPMGLAEVEEDGGIFFCAGKDSNKVADLTANPQVAVGLQGKTKFATLSGNASINLDPATMRRLWKESWKLWFPAGVDDPNLCLIHFDATEGEYWDNSGVRGIKFAISAAKAYFSGETPDTSGIDENAKVGL